MSALRTTGLRLLRRDRGVSLIELVVVITLLSLLGGIVAAWAIQAQRQVTATRIRLDDIDRARIGIDAVTKMLRTAIEPAQLQAGCSSCTGAASTSPAIAAATATSVQFYANLGSVTGPVLVTYTVGVDAASARATLTETTQPPDAGSAPNFTYTSCTIGVAGCAIRKRTLIRDIAWPLPQPVFAYYDNAAAPLTIGASGLTTQQLFAVDAVDITLPAHTTNGYGTSATTVTARVALPNADSAVLPTPAATGP